MMRASMRLGDEDDITVVEEEDYDDVTVTIMSLQGKDLNDVTEVGGDGSRGDCSDTVLLQLGLYRYYISLI